MCYNSNKKTTVNGIQWGKNHVWSCIYTVKGSQLAYGDAVKRIVRMRVEKKSLASVVVSITKISDVIHESHRSFGHLEKGRIYADATNNMTMSRSH